MTGLAGYTGLTLEGRFSLDNLFEDNLAWALQVADAEAARICGDIKYPDGEIRQSARIGLWSAAETFRGKNVRQFRAFARKRIMGLIMDEYRKELAFGPKGRLEIGHSPVPFQIEKIVARRPEAEAEDLSQYIKLLDDEKKKLVIKLRFVEDLTFDECAERMGMCASSVWLLLQGALKELRRKIAGVRTADEPLQGANIRIRRQPGPKGA